jgi:hypothetical protein
VAENWQVLSIIWFIGFGAYIWMRDIQPVGELYSGQLNTCSILLNMANDELQHIENLSDRNKRQDANWKEYEDCKKQASALHSRMLNDEKEGIPVILAIDFVTVVIGWLAVCCRSEMDKAGVCIE